MIQHISNSHFFDSDYNPEEQLPRCFTVSFKETGSLLNGEVQITLNDAEQVGDVINDNSYTEDFYRYHDIFHYAFAALLGWSPCMRAMIKRKRKSNELVDRIEDGARAAITEEAISLLVFNEAKQKNYFSDITKVSGATLRTIKSMTENFEVRLRTMREWESAILKAYGIFRMLISHKGGRVEFDAFSKEVTFSSPS